MSVEKKILMDVKAKMAFADRKFFPIYLLIGLIPFIIISYLVYENFFSSHEFSYYYDIGQEGENYLSPLDRISDPVISESYRNLSSQLVYFSVPVPRGSKTLTVYVRYKDHFPNNSDFSLGAKNAQNWSYLWVKMPQNTGSGKWVVTNATFNISQLYLQNGQLSLVFNTQHLNEIKNPLSENQIPIDWILSVVYKPSPI